MRQLFKGIGLAALCIGLLFGIVIMLASPAFAPTKQIKILGADTEEQKQLAELGSYTLTDTTEIEGVRAASFMLYNLSEQQVINKKHSRSPLPIASLTKLMTAWVVLKYGSVSDTYTITSDDINTISPSLNLVVGDEILISDLLNSLLIGSANDAAQALGNYLSLKNNQPIEDLMNQEIRNLGLTDSRFQNPIGFDSISNYSSSEDILRIVQALIPTGIFDKTSKKTSYQFESNHNRTYQIQSTNKLIHTYPDLYAIKTGFTNTALGSMVNILKFEDNEYLLIVIGSPDREADTLKLRQEIVKNK